MTRSRRAVLAACGVGLTALAGCSSVVGTSGTTPTYDPARLAALRRRGVPDPPETFPVSVPDAMVSRHLERARVLIERVPERPDVPTGTVAERLRADRAAVQERLGESEGAWGPLERLDRARDVRGDAAAVEATYRAATGAITPDAVADRRARLRATRVAFERDWTYRGDDPAVAVVVHRSLERLRREARPAIAPRRAFPGDPATDAARAGELVAHLEVGRAALSDAGRLRARYREGLSDPRPYRTAISVAASRLERICDGYREDLHLYVDADVGELPFDRSIEGTPLEWLYRWGVDGLAIFRTDAQEARHRGAPATALVATGIYLTVLRALDAIVADVGNDRVTAPGTVDGIEAARAEAVDALERAWSSVPRPLAVELAHWSWALVNNVRDRSRGPGGETDETPSTNDAYQIWAMYETATRVAAAVPRTVADAREALGTTTA